MKKLLSAVIACALAASMLTTPAFALSAEYSTDSKAVVLSGYSDDIEVFTENDYQYSIIKDKVVIRGYVGEDKFLKIPQKLGGQKVTVIGDYAFDQTNITGFSLPYDVTEIGEGAFSGCIKLETADISHVRTIGKGAFYDCNSLKEITLNPGVEEIPYMTFFNCYELTTVKSAGLSNNIHVKTIGDRAFFSCKKLSSIQNFINDAESIDYAAFSGCDSLTEVKLNNSLQKLGSRAFALCENLRSVEFTNTITDCGYELFSRCPKLEAAVIPEGTKVIRNASYEYNTLLSEVTIPDSVETIEDYAFRNCPKLGWVTIPDSVTKIWDHVFEDSPKVVICGSKGSAAETFANDHSLHFVDVTSIPYIYQTECYVIHEMYDDNGRIINHDESGKVEKNIEWDFDLNGFRVDYTPKKGDGINVRFKCNVSRFGKSNGVVHSLPMTKENYKEAEGAKGLVYFLSEEVVTDGDGEQRVSASLTCEWLRDDPDTATDTATDTASDTEPASDTASDTATDTEPASDTASDTATDTATDTEYTSGEYNYTVLDDGTAAITKYTGNDENLVIPSELDGKTVSSLGKNSFGMNQSIKTVTIPNTVTVIDNSAFTYCVNLTDVTIPDSVVTISDGAFQNCAKLNNVVVPESVKYFGVRAFGDETALTRIEFSDTNTTFANDVFEGCTNLKDIYFTGSEAEFNNAKLSDFDRQLIRDNNTTVHYDSHMPAETSNSNDFKYEFNADLSDGSIIITAYKGSDVDVVVPSMIDGHEVTKIDNYVFNDNTSITSVKLPDTVTEIGRSVFKGCTSLVNVYIPETVTNIAKYTFENCPMLESITLLEGMTRIEPFTFAECPSLKTVVIPDSITSIDSNAFYKSDNVTIICNPGTEAEQFAKSYNIPYAYPGDTEKIGILGDVNGDKRVTAKDSLIIQRYVVNIISLDDKQLKLGDVDGDNKVTAKDSLNIMRYTVKAAIKYPIGNEV